MKLLFVMSVLLVLAPSIATARCLQFEPTEVLLKGTFISKSLPGPPGYVSISKGDFPVKVLFLQLDEPICVKGKPDSTFNSRTRTGVSEIQLVVPLGQSLQLLDKRVRIMGTLFSGTLLSHRSKVLMMVRRLSESHIIE